MATAGVFPRNLLPLNPEVWTIHTATISNFVVQVSADGTLDMDLTSLTNYAATVAAVQVTLV
ncbi:hypothetical protein [Adhaeretor mobilis]|uniref:Uncharacterized protein n=1 Tax=Adhaeretor mobilis TaxID=1930276 RepID=A0A517MVG6_9BACT|nr:hypothetical protein [Adhaeretor mobilis]QDS98874.1 hypothetical protein HG15A2_21600 [Adhaeretor mobilis]